MNTMIILCFLLLIVSVTSFTSLKSSRYVRSNELNMKDYSVKVIDKKRKSENVVKVPDNKFILDAAETQQTLIPYSCRAGSCSSCLGRLISGTIDQSTQIFLNDRQMDEGYILTCVAYATSDSVIEVNIEDEFYNLPENQILGN